MTTVPDRDETWRWLRSSRSNPPGLASSAPERRAVYISALEQAEQLFRGAEHLGLAARPISIFYGLSQAAKAIAAANVPDQPAWRLGGHGISQVHEPEPSYTSIADINLKSVKGALSTVARMTDSPSIGKQVSLGTVLACLPFRKDSTSWSTQQGPILLEHIPQGMDGAILVMSPKILANVHLPSDPFEDMLDADLENQRRRIKEYLSPLFPELSTATPLPDEHQQIRAESVGISFVVELQSEQSLGSNQLRDKYVGTIGHPYGKNGTHRILYPRFGMNDAACSPIVIWWAAMFGLSVVARYEPALWVRTIDVDASGDATALEEILDDSLGMLPDQIANLIRQA